MIRIVQLPSATENTRVTRQKSRLKTTSRASGRHSSAQPTTGTRLITATATSADRNRSVMKHCGISAKVSSRVSPARTADGRNSASAAVR